MFGNANGAGEENRNVARMATLLAGLPTSLPGTTVNRLCGSSLDAAMMASRQIEVDEADLMLVGGVESMSRAPWVLPKTERPFPMQDLHLANTTLGWRLVNPEMPDAWTVSLGEATEQLREKHGITREEQDVFSARSHQLAAKAWDEGRYDDLTVTVKANSKRGSDVTRDETVRADSTPETLGGLRTVFRKDSGTVTAGNASPMNDGASAAWLGSEKAAVLLGRTPLARIAGRGAAANEPQFFGEAPVEAANLALKRAGIGWEDVSAVELNEAFAAQSLACLRQWGSRSRSSTRGAARSRSATRSAPPAPECWEPWLGASGRRAAAGAWLRCASAWARAWPSCSRTPTPPEPGAPETERSFARREHAEHRGHRGPGRRADRGRLDRHDRGLGWRVSLSS